MAVVFQHPSLKADDWDLGRESIFPQPFPKTKRLSKEAHKLELSAKMLYEEIVCGSVHVSLFSKHFDVCGIYIPGSGKVLKSLPDHRKLICAT